MSITMLLPITACPETLDHDLKMLAAMVQIYCTHQHSRTEKTEVLLHTHDVAAIAGRPVVLCSECTRLLTHALVKRSVCPMNPKPMCKHCPNHCYHPKYRQQIREVMKFSGKKMVLGGRLDYLFHLLF